MAATRTTAPAPDAPELETPAETAPASGTAVITIPTAVLDWLYINALTDDGAPRTALATARALETPWWSSRRTYDCNLAADVYALDWMALRIEELTHRFVSDRTTTTAVCGFTVYAVDAARMEIQAAQKELLGEPAF